MQARYHAFISYSHKDLVWADWLHCALESFQIPKQIRESRKLESRRLTPIFKDAQELGATSNLNDVIRNALEKSNALIVICSANAVDSRWVNEEIAEYRQFHGTRNIFCFIVDGKVPDVIPLILQNTGIEPLAVDPRPEAEGKQIALTKLVAGILDVPYDEFAQRELHRRNRRLAWIAAASVAGMVLTSSLAWYALISQQQAETAQHNADLHRRQAEDLIDFMMGDLRSKLTPIGRLDLMEDVGDQASKYFSALTGETMTEDARLRRARAMHQVGDVRFKSGDFAGARAAFRATLKETTQLFQINPQDTNRIFELGQAHYWVGFASWYHKDLDAASKHLQAYMKYSEKLVAKEPQNLDWRTELGWALSNLGTLANERNQLESAKHYFERSADIFEHLQTETNDPEFQYELSATLSWLGTLYRNLGQLDVAIENFEQEASMLRELLEDHDNANWRFSYVSALRHLGEVYVDIGDHHTAKLRLEKASEILAQLRRLDPRNTHWQFGESVVLIRLAVAEMNLGNLNQADELVIAAMINTMALLDIDANNPRWRELELETMAVQARLLLRENNLDNAEKVARKLIRRAQDSNDAYSLPVAWAETLIVEQEKVDSVRRRLARITEQRILNNFLAQNNPDVALLLHRSRHAQE